MNRISNAIDDKKIDDILTKCISSLRKKDYINSALKYENEIKNCSYEYLKYVPKKLDLFTLSCVSKDDTKNLIYIYDNKMAKDGSICRDYYDLLIANAKNICPICGLGTPNQLDHFIPKSIYPQLCLTPSNLIPICANCNKSKSNLFLKDYLKIPFHPYLEEMEHTWLQCNICFYSDKTFDIVFYNGIDNDNPLYEKYSYHFYAHNLNKTFTSFACSHISSEMYHHQKLFLEDENELLKLLNDCLYSFEKNDKNSWKSALYRELIKEFNDYCCFLKL